MIKEITNKLLEKILIHLKEKETIEKLQIVLLEPIIKYTYNRIYPYCIFIIIIFSMTFLVSLIILIILIKKK